jgi:hypothetical protein
MTAIIRQLTPTEAEALRMFAAAHGRTWKAQLTDVYWYNARIWRDPASDGANGALLHALRNDPRWSFDGLHAFKLPKN